MKRNLFLAIASTLLTLAVALGMLRWLAPGLLGIAPDLQLVRVAKRVPPFFENVFSSGEASDVDFLLRDPLTVNRGRPFYPDQVFIGSHDVLGFRNRSVPATADVVTIGDSQTYGKNAPIDLNWPGYLGAMLSDRKAVVYNMSVGGWEAPQYLYILDKALQLAPQVVVVAFYSGNDPIGSFMQAYGAEHWSDLRLDASLTAKDTPPSHWPPKPEEMWRVRFADGSGTVFTPHTRLTSNLPSHRAVDAGWSIMGEVAHRIDRKVGEVGARAVFTVIPTKELVYAQRVEAEGLQPPDAYRSLVSEEEARIRALAAGIRALAHSTWVDVVGPLQRAALSELLYRSDGDGHPIPPGYEIIANVLNPVVRSALVAPGTGLLFLRAGQAVYPLLVRGGALWVFNSMETVAANGWRFADGTWVQPRQIAGLPYAGAIATADPGRFGPGAVPPNDR